MAVESNSRSVILADMKYAFEIIAGVEYDTSLNHQAQDAQKTLQQARADLAAFDAEAESQLASITEL